MAPALAARAARTARRDRFRVLFDAEAAAVRRGLRLADPRTPGGWMCRCYDLLASEARLASFIAIAKGDVPRVALVPSRPPGHERASCTGAPLVERHAVRVPDAAAPERTYPTRCSTSPVGWPSGARWTTQQLPRALGCLRVGLRRRRPARHVSVQGVRRSGARIEAWAGRRAGGRPLRDRARGDDRARRSGHQPAAARGAGLEGEYGFFDSVDYTERGTDAASRRPDETRAGHRAHLHGPPPGHDARGVVECAARRPMVAASMPIRACRPPSSCCRSACHASRRERTAPAGRNARRPRRRPIPVRRFRTPHTAFPHAQFLSNGGSYVGDQRRRRCRLWRGLAVTRLRRDATRIPAACSSTCATSGAPTSGHRPISPRREPDDYLVTFSPDRATFRRRDDDLSAARHRGVVRGRRRGAAAGGHATTGRARARST